MNPKVKKELKGIFKDLDENLNYIKEVHYNIDKSQPNFVSFDIKMELEDMTNKQPKITLNDLANLIKEHIQEFQEFKEKLLELPTIKKEWNK